MITNNSLDKLTAEELLRFLEENYSFEIPVGIESEIAMRKSGNLLAKLTNTYAYLVSMLANITIQTKRAKSNVPAKPKTGAVSREYEFLKDYYEELALKKQILEKHADLIKHQYNCVSRMITVKCKADEELRMSESR